MEMQEIALVVVALVALLGVAARARLGLLLRRTRRDLRELASALDETRRGHAGWLAEAEARQTAVRQQLAAAWANHGNTRIELENEREANALHAAHVEGVIEALKDKGEKFDAIIFGHEWHQAGKVYAHGHNLRLYECVACRADPLANARILVKEGVLPDIGGNPPVTEPASR